MATALNYSFRLVEFIVNGGQCNRNTPTTRSDNKRPNYITLFNQVPIVQGVDKVFSNFRKGISGTYPELENEEKTPWNVFEYFYGQSALFLGYTAYGGDNILVLKLGCLVKATQKFEVFQELNLCNADDRASLLRTWILLIPTIKGIKECIENRLKTQPLLVRDLNRQISNVWVPELTKTVIGMNYSAAFMKTWIFMNDRDANIFYNNQRAVLNVLSGLENGFLKELPGEFEKLHISTESDCKVSCIFTPFCYTLPTIYTSATIRYWIVQLCNLVRFLHDHNIVHNDIRNENLLLTSEYAEQEPPPQLVLIDYDECVLLTDGATNGLPLSAQDHAPNISISHGKEVDIWGIGHVLGSWAYSVREHDEQMKFLSLAQQIKANYETMCLDDICKGVV
jgi:hypothetical protein